MKVEWAFLLASNMIGLLFFPLVIMTDLIIRWVICLWAWGCLVMWKTTHSAVLLNFLCSVSLKKGYCIQHNYLFVYAVCNSFESCIDEASNCGTLVIQAFCVHSLPSVRCDFWMKLIKRPGHWNLCPLFTSLLFVLISTYTFAKRLLY